MESNLRLVMGAAIIGIFLGVAGLVFGIVSKNKTDELRSDFSQVQGLVEKIREVEDSSTGISASATRIKRELDALRDGTQGALDQVSGELTRLRRDLNESMAMARMLEDKLTTLRRQPSPPPAPEPPPVEPAPPREASPARSNGIEAEAPSSAAAPVSDPDSDSAEEVHIIRSGDTLTAVAGRYNVSLDKLMEANPGVNPTRLQIGQEIKVPSR